MAERKFPVIEIFGPTIQGEGSVIGRQTYFVRFGGCDFCCAWCDSMHAVDPAQVRKNATFMTADEIMYKLLELPGNAPMVTLSGGNPALLELGELVAGLQTAGKQIAVETQGTKWKNWIQACDVVTVSPKPPSAQQPFKEEWLLPFFEHVPHNRLALKVVAFDEDDLDFIERLVIAYGTGHNWFISTGTRPDDTRESLCERWRAISESVLKRRLLLSGVTVLCQAHVLLWGHKQGV